MQIKNILKRVFFLVLIALLTVACSSQSPKQSEEEETDQTAAKDSNGLPPLPSHIKEEGKLVIGIKDDYPPMGFINEEGENVGYEIDFAHKLAELAFGDPEAVEFKPTTVANKIPYLNTKKIDLVIASMGVTEERAKAINFSEPYWSSGAMLLVPNESDIKGFDNLEGKKVIVMKGSTTDVGITEDIPSAELIKFDSTSQAVDALLDGRADAFAQDSLLIMEIANEQDKLKMTGTPRLFGSKGAAVAVRKGDEELLNWVNAAIEHVKEDDLFYEWIGEWLQAGEGEKATEVMEVFSNSVPRPN